MTILALHMAAAANGVSKLHGKVSRGVWRSIWPGVPEDEVPIGHVTNGVHFRSWISYEMNQLYDRYLGPNWREQPADQSLWRRVESIPAEELWRTHERRRERLVAFARRKLLEQLKKRSAPQAEIAAAEEVLDPETLTIGFARRFATYKRATLFLRDQERLARILNDSGRPVQLIFAGKAHPRDDAGKDLIRQIALLNRQPTFRRRMVFIEDYDMSITRYLVQGADVWLNTPVRPMEASGTSGMKAVANGVLSLSTLDGWWDEAWSEHTGNGSPIGWAIGTGEVQDNRDHLDQLEAEALYDLLERDVVPPFYERSGGLPRRWIALMKSSIGSLCHFFNTHRMVREYTERFYLTADSNYCQLLADSAGRARRLAAWLASVRQAWPQVRAELLDSAARAEIRVGESIQVKVRIRTGSLSPEDLKVELYLGRLDADGQFLNAVPAAMKPVQKEDVSSYIYEAAAAPCCKSGLHGYTVRVLPNHPDLRAPFVPGLITWA
jgi:starch phosphorylase